MACSFDEGLKSFTQVMILTAKYNLQALLPTLSYWYLTVLVVVLHMYDIHAKYINRQLYIYNTIAAQPVPFLLIHFVIS